GGGPNSSSSKRARRGPGGISITGEVVAMTEEPLIVDSAVSAVGQSRVPRGTVGHPRGGSTSTQSGHPIPGVTRYSTSGGASMPPLPHPSATKQQSGAGCNATRAHKG